MDDKDLGLEDKTEKKKEPETKTEIKQSAVPAKVETAQSKPSAEPPKQSIDFFGTSLDDHSEIKNKRDSNEDQFGDGNFFGNDFGDLEKDYNNGSSAAGGEADKKGSNPFGQSITQELLA